MARKKAAAQTQKPGPLFGTTFSKKKMPQTSGKSSRKKGKGCQFIVFSKRVKKSLALLSEYKCGAAKCFFERPSIFAATFLFR